MLQTMPEFTHLQSPPFETDHNVLMLSPPPTLKVRHPRCVVKFTMCSYVFIYYKTQLYLLVVHQTFATLGTTTCFGHGCWLSSGCT